MKPDSALKCVALMAELFPQADLQEAELSVFRDALLPYMESDALDAIRTHRLKCQYSRPKFNEILTDLSLRGRRESTQQRSPYKTVIAQSLVRENPSMNGKREWELILRYHRFSYFNYRKQTLYVSPEQGMREPTESEARRIKDKRESSLRQCAVDLCDIVGYRESLNMAAWFDASQKDFQSYLSEENIPEVA